MRRIIMIITVCLVAFALAAGLSSCGGSPESREKSSTAEEKQEQEEPEESNGSEQEEETEQEEEMDIREAVDTHRKVFADMHAELGDFAHWAAKQTYIAMAALLYGAASMNIDSTPIEGVDYEMMDEILHLKEKHLKTVAMVSLGYRAENDSNQSRPKSRLDLKDISASLD